MRVFKFVMEFLRPFCKFIQVNVKQNNNKSLNFNHNSQKPIILDIGLFWSFHTNMCVLDNLQGARTYETYECILWNFGAFTI